MTQCWWHSSSSVRRSWDGRSMRSPSWTVCRQLQSFCWSETAVVGNLMKPGSGRMPSWSLPSGYFLRAFMDLAGKGQDGLGRNCVRHMCYMTKQPKAAQTHQWLERFLTGGGSNIYAVDEVWPLDAEYSALSAHVECFNFATPDGCQHPRLAAIQ